MKKEDQTQDIETYIEAMSTADLTSEMYDDLSEEDLNAAEQDWVDMMEAAFEEVERERPAEEPTSGLEEIVDWHYLEKFLDAGLLRSKQQVKDYVEACFADAHLPAPSRRTYQNVLKGLFPEYREMYGRLPSRLARGGAR